MGLIGNLQDKAELFVASVKLQSVACGLEKIIDGQQIDGNEKKMFEWAGNLVGQIDWNSEHYHQNEHPELCVMATILRPTFYKTLLRLRIPFDVKFSKGLYETLKSNGGNVQLRMEELRYAHQLFQSMASDTLTELQYADGVERI